MFLNETKTKSFIFFPSRSSPLLNKRRLKRQLNKITTTRSPYGEIHRGFSFLFLPLQAAIFANP